MPCNLKLIMYINVQKEVTMITTAFTEFRKKTASYFDKVENGETVIITRHGRPVAELIPTTTDSQQLSWKKPALKMRIKGLNISRSILEDREKSIE